MPSLGNRSHCVLVQRFGASLLVYGILGLSLWSCGAKQPASPPTQTAESAASEPIVNATPEPVPSSPTQTNPPAASAENSAPIEEPPPNLPRLPELQVRNIGLHIGGGANDPESKLPFQRAIAQRFPEFMDCYRLIEAPGKSGTFGVDLHIPRTGGRARVEQPRTRLPGNAFRDCVIKTFESVEFERPAKGPTVISYSLKFAIGEEPSPAK